MRYGDQHSTNRPIRATVSWREAHRAGAASGPGRQSGLLPRVSRPPLSASSSQTSAAVMGRACPTQRASVSASVAGEASMAQLS